MNDLIENARESARLLLNEAARDESRIFSRGAKYRSLLMVARHDICGLIAELHRVTDPDALTAAHDGQ